MVPQDSTLHSECSDRNPPRDAFASRDKPQEIRIIPLLDIFMKHYLAKIFAANAALVIDPGNLSLHFDTPGEKLGERGPA